MTKTLKTRIGASLIALSLASLSAPAAAQDLPGMVTAVGTAIAAQGNAALVQIREELKDSLLETVKPYLPKPEANPSGASTDAVTVATTEDRQQ